MLGACGGKSVAKVKTESDAIEIMSVLTEYNFEVDKVEEGEGEARQWNVVVSEGWFGDGEAARAVQVLNYYWLPRREDQTGGSAASNSIIPDPQAVRAEELAALERKIEKQIWRTLPGVARTKVNIVLPEDDEIKLKPYKASASVTIVRKEEKASFTLDAVQNVVAKSVSDLAPENVSVTTWYEPPPSIPREELDLKRRNRIVLFVSVFLILLLCGLLGLLWVKTRRQRAALQALHDTADAAGGDTDAAELADGAEPARRVDGVGARHLGSGAGGAATPE